MAIGDLTELSDVAVELGLADATAMSENQQARASSLISRVSNLWSQEAQRNFVPGTDTVRLKMIYRSPFVHTNEAYVRLSEPPDSVDEVLDEQGNVIPPTQYRLDKVQQLVTFTSLNYPRYPHQFFGDRAAYAEFVTVTYTHDTPIPAAVRQIIAGIVARYVALPDSTGSTAQPSAQSLQAGGGIVTYRATFADWVTQSVHLTAEDIKVARSYRYPGSTPIVVGT